VIRTAARQAAWQAATQGDASLRPVTWSDVEQRLVAAGISRQAARETFKNLTKAGELVPQEQWVQVAGCCRPQRAYLPRALAATGAGESPFDALSRAWMGGRMR
jgi:predicted ArsR family transcriptional regulator